MRTANRYEFRNVIAALMVLAFFGMSGIPPVSGQKNVGSFDFAATLAERYDVIPNITYATLGEWEGRLDVYQPYNAPAKTPTLVWIHGGGWTRSSKEQELLYVMPYLEMGWAVVNVEYRLAARAKAPAAVEDCRCALRWVFANAEKYKFDLDRVVVSGISAGGHLALMTSMLSPKDGFDRNCPDGTDPKVAAVVNWFGPSDVVDLIDGDNAFGQAIEWIGTANGRTALASRVSPLSYIRPGLPPIFTVHGENDETIPYGQSVRLHRELTRSKVPNGLFTVRGRGHGDFSRAEWIRAHAAVRAFLKRSMVR